MRLMCFARVSLLPKHKSLGCLALQALDLLVTLHLSHSDSDGDGAGVLSVDHLEYLDLVHVRVIKSAVLDVVL